MKNNVMFLLGMAMSMMAYGQKQTQITIDEMSIIPPHFTAIATIWHGHEIESISDYVGKLVEYPQGTSNKHLLGTEVVQFEVSPTGELNNFQVINSVSSEIDAEVIRVIKTTKGMWKPGFVNEQPVPMKKEISIVFKPYDNYNMTMVAKAYHDKGNEILHLKKNPKKAMMYFNKAIRLLPNEISFLAARSLCRYELGDELGALADCKRIIQLDNTGDFQLEATFPIEAMKQLKGYAELSYLLKKHLQ